MKRRKTIIEAAGDFTDAPKDRAEEHFRDVVVAVESACFDTSPMQAYALRIWNGQSPDLPRATRVRYVEEGLRGQGWTDFTGLKLPE